jgi:GAF domain-containing protein
MQKPENPINESERLAGLRQLEILDTEPEERFDRVTKLARSVFNVPIALVSLVDKDRQWFKSSCGLDASETPRDISFCGHAILGKGIFLIPDALEDSRFKDNPLVTGKPYIRFYAGIPLHLPGGLAVGTLCIIDTEPRNFSEKELDHLQDLALVVEQELLSHFGS